MVVGEFTQETDLLIIGGGPGGYHTAFRAASHGIQTTIVDAEPGLGGVCLHRGCIPSKTYLHLAETIHAANSLKAMGIEFGPPNASIHKIDEHVDVRFIEPLKNIYRGVLERLIA